MVSNHQRAAQSLIMIASQTGHHEKSGKTEKD
jgi:hypothetical protein